MTNCFLVGAFFFPRMTLLICWLMSAIPANSTPFLVDVLAAWLAPRLLIAFWLYEANAHPALIGIFLISGILALGGESSTVSKRSET